MFIASLGKRPKVGSVDPTLTKRCFVVTPLTATTSTRQRLLATIHFLATMPCSATTPLLAMMPRLATSPRLLSIETMFTTPRLATTPSSANYPWTSAGTGVDDLRAAWASCPNTCKPLLLGDLNINLRDPLTKREEVIANFFDDINVVDFSRKFCQRMG